MHSVPRPPIAPRRGRWPLLAATLAVAVTSVVPAVPSSATPPRAPERIVWGACPTPVEGQTRDPRQQCGTLRVPLDHRRPHGRTIEVAVSRIPAADPDRRQGVLLLNGGGPSASLDIPTMLAPLLPAEVVRRHDLVAFDPRGAGYSTPMQCGRDAEELVRDQEIAVLSFPAGDGSIDRNVRYSREMAARCAQHSGDLLPYLTTANIARDMDLIRRALREDRVSYYGLSWGTYLGAVYRELFGRHVDRMVLDSSVDPNLRGYDDFRIFSVGMDDRFPDLARYVAAQHDTVGFGDTPREVRTAYLKLAARLDRSPVTVPGSAAPLTGNLLRSFTLMMSYSDGNLPTLAALWRAAADLAAGTATDEDVSLVHGLSHQLVTAGTLPGVPQDNLFSIGWAISCGDQRWPRDVRTYARNTAVDRILHPLTAGAPANVAPCTFWASQPIEPQVRVRATGARNVLILQNRRDPATPLFAAEGMRRALGSRAVLVDVDAGGHGVLIDPEPSRCAIGVLETFLTDGRLPARDRSCPAA